MAENKTLQLPKGSAWFAVSDGVVTHDKTWSETHVSASGGGASVVNNTVFVQPVSVRSDVSEQREFWIQEDDGTETSIRFSDVNFAVRPGQRVRVVWGANAKRKQGGYLYAHNYASRESMSLVPNWYDWARKQNLTSPPLLYRLMTTWLSLAIALLIGMVCAALYVGNHYASNPSAAASKPVVQDINAIQTQINNSGSLAPALHVPNLVRLGTDAVSFAVSGVRNVSAPPPRTGDNLYLPSVLMGLGIGIAVWLPLVLVFHIIGTLVFHMWWRAAQHQLLARKIQPLFAV